MTDQLSTMIEKLKGRAKQKAGELLNDEDLSREGAAQRKKADAAETAEDLEELAEDKRQEAHGHRGEQVARSGR